MPEGDTVWRTARRLDEALAGEPLVLGELRWPSLAGLDLVGATTLEVVSRGKHLLHRLDTGTTIHSHLRMEGQWRVAHPGPDTARLLRRSDVRAALGTDRWTAVGLRLGMLDAVPTAREDDLVGHLGPDVLGPDWDPDRAAAAVAAYPGTVGEALLDQRTLAGVGTFWASEALFLERLLPWTPAADLTKRGGRCPRRPGPAAPRCRAAPCRPVEHRHPPAGSGGLRPRPLRPTVSPLRRRRAGRLDRDPTARASALLVPDLSGRARADRRRQATATARQRQAVTGVGQAAEADTSRAVAGKGSGSGAVRASVSATRSETAPRTWERGRPRAEHTEKSSSEDASLVPRSISLR